MKNILFELRLALNIIPNVKVPVSKGEERLNQYITGLTEFFKYYKEIKSYNVDVIFVDNTLEDISEIPEIIQNLLPDDILYFVKHQNNYGFRNKGAGDIEMWKEYVPIIRNYKWFFALWKKKFFLG